MNNFEKIICDHLVFNFSPNLNCAVEKSDFYNKLVNDESVETFDPYDTKSARDLFVKIIVTIHLENNSKST